MSFHLRRISVFFLLLSFLFSCSYLEQERLPSSTSQLDLVKEFVTAPLSPERRRELEVLRFNMLRFLIHASYQSEAQKIEEVSFAREYFVQTSAKILQNYAAQSAGQEHVFEISHPPSWTLNTEVEFLKRELAQDQALLTPEFLALGRNLFAQMDLSDIPLGHIPKEIDAQGLVNFLREVQTLETDEAQILAFMRKFEGEIDSYFDQVRNVGTQLAAHPDIELGDAEATKFLKLFLNHYFHNVDEDILKTILVDMMLLGREPTPLEAAQIMFRNSGPGLGKGLQQLGKEPTMGKALSEILATLEDAGKIVPHYLVEQTLSADPSAYVFTEIAPTPLGTGTVAQVQKATLLREGAEITVAARFLKPGIADRAKDDIRILTSFVQKLKTEQLLSPQMIPQVEKLVVSLSEFLYQELDIDSTIQNQRKAQEVYDKTVVVAGANKKKFEVEFVIPKLFMPENPESQSQIHIQEFLPPKTKFAALKYRSQREPIATAIFDLFFREALFGSGYMHSDLHQGNFSVLEVKNQRARVAIYDFGMAHQLSLSARRSFLLVGAGTELNNAGLLARGFLSFKSESTRQERRALEKLIELEMKAKGLKTSEEWIVWGLQTGHLESPELGAMARGSLLVWQLPKSLGLEQQMKDHLEKMVKDEVKASLRKENFPLTKADRIGLALTAIKGNCFELISGFFKRN